MWLIFYDSKKSNFGYPCFNIGKEDVKVIQGECCDNFIVYP